MLTILVLCELLLVVAAVSGYLLIFSGTDTISDGSQPTKTRNIKPTPSTPNLVVALGNPTLWISKEEPLSLRVVVISLCLLLVVGAVHQLQLWYDSSFHLVLTVAFVVIAYGLLRLSSWARWVTIAILWFLIFAIVNPFLAADLGRGTLSETTILAIVWAIFIPAIIGSLWCLHILGEHKLRFR